MKPGYEVFSEAFPGVSGNKGSCSFPFREHWNFGKYFKGTREKKNKFWGTGNMVLNFERLLLGNMTNIVAVFAKSAGLPDKLGIFSFCPAKTFSLSDNYPVNLSKENNILSTKMPSVLQILLSCK